MIALIINSLNVINICWYNRKFYGINLAYYLGHGLFTGFGMLLRSWHISRVPGYCLMNPAELPKYCQESVGSRL
jgi:hypothetical protein